MCAQVICNIHSRNKHKSLPSDSQKIGRRTPPLGAVLPSAALAPVRCPGGARGARVQVQEVCRLVCNRGARLTAAAIGGILFHLGRDPRANRAAVRALLLAPRRTSPGANRLCKPACMPATTASRPQAPEHATSS